MASLCVVTIFQNNPGSAGGVDPVAAKQVVFYFNLDFQGYLIVAIVVEGSCIINTSDELGFGVLV